VLSQPVPPPLRSSARQDTGTAARRPAESSTRQRPILFPTAGSSEVAPAGGAPVAAKPFRLHGYFRDGAVLQQGQPLNVRGFAPAGTRVTVTLLGGQVPTPSQLLAAVAVANAAGQWMAALGTLNPALAASGPYSLQAATAGGDVATAQNLLVGQVYLVSAALFCRTASDFVVLTS